jgi:hypothetical protein
MTKSDDVQWKLQLGEGTLCAVGKGARFWIFPQSLEALTRGYFFFMFSGFSAPRWHV